MKTNNVSNLILSLLKMTDDVFLLEVWYRIRLVTARFISYGPHDYRWPVLIAADQLLHDFFVMLHGFCTQIVAGKMKER